MKITKKTLILLSMLVLLFTVNLGNLSAWNFDNVGEYNEGTKTMTIVNAFGLGNTIANITLISPHTVNVIRGQDRLVAEFKIDNFVESSDYLNQLEFFNKKKNMEKIKRNFKYKYINNNEYKAFNKNTELGVGEIYIGIFADVESEDSVEWIPTIYGVEIPQWATFNESMNLDLQHYWSMNEPSGTILEDERGRDLGANQYNLTITGTVNKTDGINGYALSCNEVDTYAQTAGGTFGMPNTGTTFTINIWIKAKDDDSFDPLWSMHNGDSDRLSLGTYQTNRFIGYSGSNNAGSGTGSLTVGTWQMVTVSQTGGTVTMYINGLSNATYTDGTHGATTFQVCKNGYGALLGAEVDELMIWNRSLNAGEISALYSGGVGEFYIESNTINTSLNNPIDYYNTTSQTINFNCSGVDDSIVENVSLWIDGSLNYTQTDGVDNFTELYQTLTLGEGTHDWTCLTSDDENNIDWATNRTLTIDNTDPVVTITYPTGNIDDDFVSGNTKTIYINYTATDANLDTCWYYNNSANVTISCGTNASFTLPYGSYTHYVYSNDSLNNIGSSSINVDYTYKLLGNSQTYNSSTIENSIENFITNVSFNSSKYSIVNAQLYYNGTTYTTTRTSSETNFIFTKEITIPLTEVENNKSFKWLYSLTNSSGTIYFNSTPTNQFINRTNASILGSPYNNNFINFTIYDEKTLVKLNSSFEITLNYGLTSFIRNLSYSNTSTTNTWSFGFEPPDKTYLVMGTAEYSKTGYITRLYTLPTQYLSNSTTNVNLYLLNSSDSTTFIIAVRDSAYSEVEGAEVHVQRYYPDTDSWLTTEIVTTNYEGKTIGHFETGDVDYRFLVYVDNVLRLTTTSTKVFTETSPYTITLTLEGDAGFATFDNLTDFDYSLSYSKTTETFTYSYTDDSATADGGRLIVLRSNFGNVTVDTVCDTSSLDSSAVLVCDISSEINGTYYAYAYNERTDATTLVDTLIITKSRDVVDNFGYDGVVWGFFLIMGIIMLGLYKPTIAIVFTMASAIFVSILGIISIPIVSIAAIIMVGLILLWGMRT